MTLRRFSSLICNYMRLKHIILFIFGISNLSVFAQQNLDTVQIKTIKVHRSTQPLRALLSYSNTLYTNVSNLLTITYPDTTLNCYDIEASPAYTKKLPHGKFIIVKHNPGVLTVTIYKTLPSGKQIIVAAQDFDVKPLPPGSLTIGGTIIDSTVSASDLALYKELNVAFGDFFPMDNMCHVDTFDLRINNQQYQSFSNQLTDDMLNALKNFDGVFRFINVKVSLNSQQDITREVDAKTKKVTLKHDEYILEDTSKYIHMTH
jgi:hypothetical protein